LSSEFDFVFQFHFVAPNFTFPSQFHFVLSISLCLLNFTVSPHIHFVISKSTSTEFGVFPPKFRNQT
jgi:hypothetical protein